jgi:intracellular septation protein
MKFLFDFFPLVLFFAAFQLYDVYVATAVAIAATFAQIGWLKLRRRKVDTMLWVSLAIIVVFGGLTLALHDETFIKWKPTALYWIFAVVLAVSDLGLGRNLIRAMLGAQLQAPDFAWRRANLGWVVFFLLMGAANLYVAYTFPLATWVKVKVFGGMGMLLLFALLQAVYLSRHIEAPSTGSGPGADDAAPPR